MIEVKNLGKKFEVFQEKRNSLYDYILKSNQYPTTTIWALKNISFNLKKGEVLGIIGKNGSGKSTLLKILACILQPTEGHVSIEGKVLPFIELGIGFESELTGIENIHLHGSILGLTKEEIKQKIKDVIDFADIGPFIHSKLKTYSSGMIARLAFSTALMVGPDVLLIDEILAVGDEEFQRKSFAKILDFKRNGKTIVLVSHNLDLIRILCDTCILLDRGRSVAKGKPDKVIEFYLKNSNHYRPHQKSSVNMNQNIKPHLGIKFNSKLKKTKSELAFELTKLKSELAGMLTPKRRLYNSDFKITEVNIPRKKNLRTGERLIIEINYLAQKKLEKPMFGISILNEHGVEITGPNTTFSKSTKHSIKGEGKVRLIINKLPLLPGTYYLSVSLSNYEGKECYDLHDALYKFKVLPKNMEKQAFGIIDLNPKWEYE